MEGSEWMFRRMKEELFAELIFHNANTSMPLHNSGGKMEKIMWWLLF